MYVFTFYSGRSFFQHQNLTYKLKYHITCAYIICNVTRNKENVCDVSVNHIDLLYLRIEWNMS